MKYGTKYWCTLPNNEFIPVTIYYKTAFDNDLEVATAVDLHQAKIIINALNTRQNEILWCSGLI